MRFVAAASCSSGESRQRPRSLAAAVAAAPALPASSGRQHPDRRRKEPPAGNSSSTARPSPAGAATRRNDVPRGLDRRQRRAHPHRRGRRPRHQRPVRRLRARHRLQDRAQTATAASSTAASTDGRSDLLQRARVPGPRQRRSPRRQERPRPLLPAPTTTSSRRPTNVCKPAGEWNSARIVVRGAHVEHWLNGEKVVEYEFWTARVESAGRRQASSRSGRPTAWPSPATSPSRITATTSRSRTSRSAS